MLNTKPITTRGLVQRLAALFAFALPGWSASAAALEPCKTVLSHGNWNIVTHLKSNFYIRRSDGEKKKTWIDREVRPQKAFFSFKGKGRSEIKIPANSGLVLFDEQNGTLEIDWTENRDLKNFKIIKDWADFFFF